MKVLDKNIMPDGTKIQLENWKEDYPTTFTTFTIGAYPIAKNDGCFIKRNETFRLSLDRNFANDNEVRLVFEGLIGGSLTLEELSDHYWNGDKDRYYMGLKDKEN